MRSYRSFYPPTPNSLATPSPCPLPPAPAALRSTSTRPNEPSRLSCSPIDMHSDSYTTSALPSTSRAPPPPTRTTRTSRPPSRSPLDKPTASNSSAPRSLSRKRRYRLPSPPTSPDECCCCCETSGGEVEAMELPNHEGRRRTSGSRVRADRRRGSSEQDDDVEEVLSDSALASSGSGESLVSTAPSSSARGRLFDSDDEDDDVLSAYTTDDTESMGSFSPATPASWWSPPTRKTSLSRSPSLRKSSITRSDPLISPSSSPSLSFGKASASSPSPRRRGSAGDRGHWMPPPPETTAFCVSKSPELPDTLQLGPAPSPPPSPPRRLSPPISLLTKSLRSLSRLPNLLPRLPTPDSYLSSSPSSSPIDDLSGLAPGWGSAERRRILAEEPSHAADEARGFTLSRRRVKTQMVDEVEAAAVSPAMDGLALSHLGPSGAKVSPPPSPTSPTADQLPLPHPLPASPSASSSSPSASAADPFSPVPLSASPSSSAAPLPPSPATSTPPSPSPPPRFISNHRHLLMLSLEFEMMRHAKIRGPLRQRAVIVRQASPPRLGAGAGAGGAAGEYRVESGLRREVCV